MTDPSGTIAERLDQLLAEANPKHTKQEELRGHQYDLGYRLLVSEEPGPKPTEPGGPGSS